MNTCRCIEKLRGKHKIIIGYRVRFSDGEIKEYNNEEITSLIASGKLQISNLKINSKGQVVDKYYMTVSAQPSNLKLKKVSKEDTFARSSALDRYDFGDYGGCEYYRVLLGRDDYVGYIKDKKGRIFNVIAYDKQCDSGYISGGGMDYYVCIEHSDGDIILRGYRMAFGGYKGTSIVWLLQEGIYLEDYLERVKQDKASIEYRE